MNSSSTVTSHTVPLHLVLEIGSLITAFICLAALSSWALGNVPLVSPFGALMGLVATPFFFAMGRVARRGI